MYKLNKQKTAYDELKNLVGSEMYIGYRTLTDPESITVHVVWVSERWSGGLQKQEHV